MWFTYDPIQGQVQGHGSPKVAKMVIVCLSPPPVRLYCSQKTNGELRCDTSRQYLNFNRTDF